MSSGESDLDETGVDRMGVLIIEHMMLHALPRSDAVQALIASGGDVVEACARFVPSVVVDSTTRRPGLPPDVHAPHHEEAHRHLPAGRARRTARARRRGAVWRLGARTLWGRAIESVRKN